MKAVRAFRYQVNPGFGKRTAGAGLPFTLTLQVRVRAGSDFSTALSEHGKLFTKIYVNMIKAGEASGQLDVILQRLADYMESVEELKREIKAAMTYPIISLVLILSITVGLVVGIVPKFQVIFTQLGMTKLPARRPAG